MNLTPPAATDDDELPALGPLDDDDGRVEIPEESLDEAWDASLDDNEVLGVDPRAFSVLVFDDAPMDDDGGSDDDPMDALPDDERDGWTGDDDRPSDEVAEAVIHTDCPPRSNYACTNRAAPTSAVNDWVRHSRINIVVQEDVALCISA